MSQSTLCSVCFKASDEETVQCSQCSLVVHGTCYGCSFSSNGDHSGWKCRYCYAVSSGAEQEYEDTKLKAITCRICNQRRFGALKSCGKNKGFAHLVCAIWTPFTCVQSWYNMAPINGIDRCQQYEAALKKLVCCLCHKSHATIKCRMKSCRLFFHPLCLMEHHRHCMIEQDGVIDSTSTKIFYTYCPHHVGLHQEWDPRQAEKASNRREVIFNTNVAEMRAKKSDIRMKEISEFATSSKTELDDDDDDEEEAGDDDDDSDVVILSSTKTPNTGSRKGSAKEIRSHRNDNDTNHNEAKGLSECAEQCLLAQSVSPHPQLALQLEHTPLPSLPIDVASQWTERFQNPVFSDRESVVGFDPFKSYSPLLLRHDPAPEDVLTHRPLSPYPRFTGHHESRCFVPIPQNTSFSSLQSLGSNLSCNSLSGFGAATPSPTTEQETSGTPHVQNMHFNFEF